jgi:hypothetical protein
MASFAAMIPSNKETWMEVVGLRPTWVEFEDRDYPAHQLSRQHASDHGLPEAYSFIRSKCSHAAQIPCPSQSIQLGGFRETVDSFDSLPSTTATPPSTSPPDAHCPVDGAQAKCPGRICPVRSPRLTQLPPGAIR